MSTNERDTMDAPHEPTTDEIDSFEICPTPPELALAICKRVDSRCWINPVAPRILEPSAGNGAFVAAIRATWPSSSVTAVEIRHECHDALFTAGADHVVSASLEDALTSGISAADPTTFDLVIGNPPYSLAEKHIRLLLGAMKPNAVLAFLLKLSFYESRTRVPFWEEFPEDAMAPIVPRPGFKLNGKGKSGTDSQAYALFTWIAGAPRGDHAVLTRPQRLPHIIWEPPKPKKRRRPKAQLELFNDAPMANAEQGEQPQEGGTDPVELE